MRTKIGTGMVCMVLRAARRQQQLRARAQRRYRMRPSTRCLAKNLPNFTEQYVFTKESLERFIEQIKQEQNNESA